LSDLIEVAVAGLAMFHCSRASGRSTGLARSFWALAATTFTIAFVDFSLMVWSEFFPGSVGLQWVGNMLGCFWFFPLALGMFLDPERETEGLDLLVAVDFVQAAVFCVAAYLYFFYIPKSSAASQLFNGTSGASTSAMMERPRRRIRGRVSVIVTPNR